VLNVGFSRVGTELFTLPDLPATMVHLRSRARTWRPAGSERRCDGPNERTPLEGLPFV